MVKEPNPDNIDRIGSGDGEGPRPALIAFVVLVIIAIVFIIQNRSETEITFLFFDVRSKVWSAIAAAILLGVIIDRVFTFWWQRRRR